MHMSAEGNSDRRVENWMEMIRMRLVYIQCKKRDGEMDVVVENA